MFGLAWRLWLGKPVESKLSCKYRDTRDMQAAGTALRPLQPGSSSLFRGEEFAVNGIVDHARHQLPILIRRQPWRPMFETQRNIEERKAVGEIGGAVERIDIPPVSALQAGAGSLFAIDAVIGKLLTEPADDEFFRCPVGFGHQVYVAFIFRGHAAIEVAAKQFAGLQSNARCAGGKTKIQLLRKVLQRALLSSPLALRALLASRRPRSLMVRIWCL